MGRPTVRDVADRAGVSVATVDRVLNERAGVRAGTIVKVHAAISALGYVKDTSAANLARGQTYHFAFFIPDGTNGFMRQLETEIRKVQRYAAATRTEIAIHTFPPFDADALATKLDALDPAVCSGVAVVANDALAVRDAIARLRRMNIPVVTLVSDIPSFQRDAYVGIDNVAAGRTAARLMGRFLGPRSGKIMLVMGSELVRDHVERRMGFQQIMSSEFPHLICLPAIAGRDDSQVVETKVAASLTSHDDIVGIYSIGAGNRGLIRAAANRDTPSKYVIIAHELTAPMRMALTAGSVDAVIHQDAGHEIRSALRILRARVDKTPLLMDQEDIRIEIYLNENLPSAGAIAPETG